MPLIDKPVPRRGFLLRIAAGTGALWSGVKSLPLLAGSATGSPTVLTEQDRKALARMVHLLFPHEGLYVQVYHQAGDFLARRYAGNHDTLILLKAGVRMLDGDNDTRWLDRSPGEQLARLHEVEHTEFFRLVRNSAIEYLYRDPQVWEMLGYEGPSISFGGYLNRGLADIDWLPRS